MQVKTTYNYKTSEFCSAGYALVCYTTSQAQERPAQYVFTNDLIEADLCTHVIHAFSHITNGVLELVESNDASECSILCSIY